MGIERVIAPPRAVSPKTSSPQPDAADMVMPTKDERRQLFEMMDTSGDGSLTVREVETAVSTLWPQFNNAEAMKVAFRAADSSEDGQAGGTIGRREFGLFLEHLVFFNKLWSKFSILDGSGDGRLDVEEFQKGCKMVGIKLKQEQVAHEFGTMDIDGGGTIVFSEFCVWSARRGGQCHGSDEEDVPESDEDEDEGEEKQVGLTLELELELELKLELGKFEQEEKTSPTHVRSATPPPVSASGRRVRVQELAAGRMTRVPPEVKQETKHPSHFTVWMITKHGNTSVIYPQLRNLAHAFMFDSTNLVPVRSEAHFVRSGCFCLTLFCQMWHSSWPCTATG